MILRRVRSGCAYHRQTLPCPMLSQVHASSSARTCNNNAVYRHICMRGGQMSTTYQMQTPPIHPSWPTTPQPIRIQPGTSRIHPSHRGTRRTSMISMGMSRAAVQSRRCNRKTRKHTSILTKNINIFENCWGASLIGKTLQNVVYSLQAQKAKNIRKSSMH